MNDASLFSAIDREVGRAIVDSVRDQLHQLSALSLEERVEVLNAIKRALHEHSPFATEPVDCVIWVPAQDVLANDYNPNTVAPPEMRLLEHSIGEDGYTQPIVTWKTSNAYEVIDGFHRHRVGKESAAVAKRIRGYLPITVANADRTDRGDRIAATIRHNRARGKHRVEAMSDIVVELKRRNWSDEKIGRDLGMDADEVLRLCQISGLAEAFADQEFSAAWDVDADAAAHELIADDDAPSAASTSGRVFHTWDKWECYPAGFYEDRPPDGMTQEQGEEAYREFLSDPARFAAALEGVITTWKHSCEHYLTNERMNRIAWLGQASMAYAHRIPSCCRGGYNRLTDSQKRTADLLALQYLNKWRATRGESPLTEDQARSKTQMDLY